MKAKVMVKQWNEMRTQIIQAQLAPTLVLIAIVALAALGKFENAMSAIPNQNNIIFFILKIFLRKSISSMVLF